MSVWSRLDRLWYAPAPAERLSVLRVLVGAYAVVYLAVRYASLTVSTGFDPRQFAPVGPVRLLSAPLPALAVHALTVCAIALGLAFVAGFRYRYTGPLFAALFLWVTSYRSAWGMIFHTDNLVALHLLLLGVAPAADALAVDTRAEPSSPHGRYGWAIRAMCTVTVVTYVLAGLAKLRLAGWHWAEGEILRSQVAYDNLRKIALGSLHSPLGAALVKHAWPFAGLSWASLVLELGAPVALLERRLGYAWVTGVSLFHLGVLALMAIAFPYQLSLIAYASFLPVERVLDQPRCRALLARLGGAKPSLPLG